MLQTRKKYLILFLVFAAFFILTQFAFLTNSRILHLAAAPFEKVFPYDWGFFSPAKPYNYRVEINWYNPGREKLHSEEIVSQITGRHMNSFISGSAFLDYELFSQACITYHYADWLREQHSEEIKNYTSKVSDVNKAIVRYIDLNLGRHDAYSFDYAVYITDISKPNFKERIYQSGLILNDAKYRGYR